MLLNLILQNYDFIIIAIVIAGFIFSIGFHEFAHAKSAQLLGDPTPAYQGRVTINPIAHLDPIGTVAMLIAPFGWGKPVQVNPANMGSYPERKYFLTSICGPLANVTLAFICFLVCWGIVILLNAHALPTNVLTSVFYGFRILFSLNIVLAIFNLLPIPPLDGSKIWGVILPVDMREKFEPFIERYSLFLMILLIVPIFGSESIASIIVSPVTGFITENVFKLIL